MKDQTSKTIAVFSREFTVPGCGETLPAGEYEIETKRVSPPDSHDPEAVEPSVSIKLHPRASHPGLERTMTVSLAELDHARGRDKLSGTGLSEVLVGEMLADPIVRLVMAADGVSEAHLRHLYSGLTTRAPDGNGDQARPLCMGAWDVRSIEAAENEGMPSGPEAILPSGRCIAGIMT